jgi:hypothetical protein
MPAIASTVAIDPKRLDAEARARLIDELYAVQCSVFDGVERAPFASYVVESKAEHTTVHVHRNAAGAAVGYCALHVFEPLLDGRPCAVLRMEAGSLGDYRGGNSNASLALRAILRYRRANPRRPLYYLGTLVHPSSYSMFAKYAPELWPNPDRPVPAAVARLLRELAELFHLEPVDPANPLVVEVGWRTRDTEAERRYWRGTTKPAARFFIDQNPGYGDGQGLMTLVPVNGRTLAVAVGRVAADLARRRRDGALVAVQRLPGVARFAGAWSVRRRLAEAPLFAGLEPDAIAALAAATETVTFSAGSYVLREGDPGNELYVVASGGVYVVDEHGGAPVIIDQLGPGAMFGEIAMLAGEPRSASIRTATRTSLLRLHRRALLGVMDTHAGMRADVWQSFAVRRFNSAVLASPRFQALGQDDRAAWFASGRSVPLSADETLAPDASWLFVASGTFELEQRGTWQSLRGPALMRLDAPATVTARTPLELRLLPDHATALPAEARAQ